MRLLRRNSPAPPAKPAVRVLLVCMGNICRSPMAEGVLRQRIAARELPLPVEIDSAGTHGYHPGAPPDARAQAAALRRKAVSSNDITIARDAASAATGALTLRTRGVEELKGLLDKK